MSTGRCDRCGRPFTAGEVTGLGVLKPRPERDGGPTVEFSCPACRAVLHLVPHGKGRYAVVGDPPPPEPPEDERVVPWRRGRPTGAPDAPRSRAPRAAAGGARPPRDGAVRDEPPPARTKAGAPPPPATGARSSAAPPPAEAPLDEREARRLLGVREAVGLADLDAAYRRQALLCHPDKVAHLDPDLQALAAAKFVRLGRARDLLARRAARDSMAR